MPNRRRPRPAHPQAHTYIRGRSNARLMGPVDHHGRWVVLVFYPRDFTFVCPTELAELADLAPAFIDEDAAVMAVSTDSWFTHRRWFEDDPLLAGVGYPVIADTAHELARAVCAFVVLAVAPPAALGGATSIETVKVRMSEYRIRLDRAHVTHTYFIFDLRNTGKVEHEFVIVKTARTAKRLPVANGQVSRRGWKGPVPLQPGGHRNLVFPNLRPGHYVLLCGIAGHYQKGMRRDFTLR